MKRRLSIWVNFLVDMVEIGTVRAVRTVIAARFTFHDFRVLRSILDGEYFFAGSCLDLPGDGLVHLAKSPLGVFNDFTELLRR
ncbi:hypothetical protein C474_06522 [Halogeometricum pallidum JCM 14848]|uniref:Uncharacterized protein n=1 Tax=Halogeometricum pallidum JCM 14848 TaxID=1227487 RepID=M0DE64_HALPD|nr:hypothetical protein C474_06522 [Halogeometricum pallidum JCM 14848]